MKCPNCGAEITDGKSCAFCGIQITAEMRKEQELINKAGCPKCGSSNITFDREKQGELKGKNGTAVIRATVGLCKDCGYTWTTQGNETEKKKRTWLWVLGWICIFPLPLTILLVKKKEMKPVLKYVIIALAWIIYFAIGASGSSSDSNNSSTNSSSESTVAESTIVSSEEITKELSAGKLYDNVEIRDVFNGTRDSKIGEYAVIYATSEECTEEALADLYFNYFEKNDFNWLMIIYTDKNDNTGVYINTAVVCVNDQFIKDDYGDYSVGESPEEILYTPNDDGKSLNKIAEE